MLTHDFLKNIKYYGSFQLIVVIIFIILSSVGAFFHFLLNHEISIVESWLHNNHWEVLILAKALSLYLLHQWFRLSLYELKSIKQLLKENVKWPEHKAVVVSTFMIISYLSLSGTIYLDQNLGNWYYHLISFLALIAYFGIEFIVILYIADVLNQKEPLPLHWLGFAYSLIFALAFRLSIPDYYGLFPFVLICFISLLFISGKNFKNWSNVVCFLVVFVAPMGSIFGLDPVWGDDFSLFRVKTKLGFSFLAVIWMVSFGYYTYRDQIIIGAKKLLR